MIRVATWLVCGAVWLACAASPRGPQAASDSAASPAVGTESGRVRLVTSRDETLIRIGPLDRHELADSLAWIARRTAATPPSAVAVHVIEAGQVDEALPDVAGEVHVDGHDLVFAPAVPFAPGVMYRVRWQLPGRALQEARVVLPAIAAEPTTRVVQVLPSVDVVPANVLRFRVRFSAAMREADAFLHVRLVEVETGRVLEHPWAQAELELWDRAHRELTLLLDPGRIKRGLARTGEADGAVGPDRHYRLEIDAAWRDATGQPLVAPFVKAFRTTAADRSSPDPGQWRIVAPPAGTRAPLVVELDEPLDGALLARGITVVGAGGVAIVGDSGVGDGERSWWFRPARPWPAGPLALELWPRISDLAGNDLRGLFDRDPAAPVPMRSTRLRFRCGTVGIEGE